MDKFIDLSIRLLRQGKSIRFQAPGHSMQPTIREGEVITIEPIAPSAVHKGDIILYTWEHGILVHRVIGIKCKGNDVAYFITRGDAALTCDSPVSSSQILGKVISVERKGRCIKFESTRTKVYAALGIWFFHCKGFLRKIIRPYN
ncbi:MAG: signal peptidase I [bacterium]